MTQVSASAVRMTKSSTDLDMTSVIRTHFFRGGLSGIQRIVRVESAYLYGQFLLKKEEYETKGGCTVKQLYHDTAASNIDSILINNLDWRLANRVKYGRGVSFSPSSTYANRQSSRSNGIHRAMIIADVLVQYEEHVSSSADLPSYHYDTTVGNNGQVYVKFL
ncbi:hypothetical protein FQR65_LT17757 [Abscondita terminalis]|nr:hypothetical protein FQR65_LT17757 [Abscondita terminalis]